MRISSASVPPSAKNTKVVTRYRIPIFLWSVVVTQSIHRLVWRGRVTSCAVTCGTGLRVSGSGAVSVVTDICWLASKVPAGGEDLT